MTSLHEGLAGEARGGADHGLPSLVTGGGEEHVCPVIMCTLTSPDPEPEFQLFSAEEEPEEGVARESDRDSAVESSQGSETSEGPATLEEKDDTLGDLFFSGEKCAQTSVSVTSDLSTRSSASLNEEQFEDYGEGEEADCTASSPSPDDETRTNGYSDLGSSVPSSAGQTPRKVRHHYAGDLMDVYCSQCSKKVNLLNDLEARLKHLRASSPSRKMSSTAFGRQLLHHSNLSSRTGSTEDLFPDGMDSCDTDLHEKLEVQILTQLHCVCRVKHLEEENSSMSLNMNRLKSQTERLDEEKQKMTDKLEDTSLRLKDEMDLYKKMMEKLKQSRQQYQKEKDAMQELIEDLRRELEHLQLYKLEAEKPGRSRSASSGLADFSSRTREVELEHEVKRLKQENQKMKEQNDELNGQIISLSLFEAKNLFATQTKAQSLAAEIDTASKDQLVEALKEQEEINLRLRQYMDKIILSILDHNPSILEIKT
ncbi:rab11 family-interacting protein 4 [Nematolebias whitei]|uniref:rab11 family-interacting protein 4 n=1 Tax=Nematolebias whitei TaxID=451745 RepID=UPI001896AB37|nr:rab11 family-interacting protein 4 [Nematolebias whitei]